MDWTSFSWIIGITIGLGIFVHHWFLYSTIASLFATIYVLLTTRGSQ